MSVAARRPPQPSRTAQEEPLTYLLIRDGVERRVTAEELTGAGPHTESNIQRLISALEALPKPRTVEVRDTELIPEPKGL